MSSSFKKENLLLHGQCISDSCLSIYRAIAALVSLIPAIIVLIFDPTYFVFYLTDWGLIITCIYFWYIVAYTFITTRPNTFNGLFQKHLKALSNEKAAHYLFELAWSTEFVVAGCYWIGSIFFTLERTMNQRISSYIVHSVPFSLLVIDTILNSIRFQKMHFILLQPVYIAYGIVNWMFVHFKIGPNPIYPRVTWDNWETPFGICCSELTCLIGFIFAYKLGEFKYRRRAQQMNNKDSLDTSDDLNITAVSTEPLTIETQL